MQMKALLRPTAVAAVLVLGVAACGSDDDDSAASTTTAGDPGTEPAAGGACDAIVDFNDAVFQFDSEEASPEDLTAAGDQLVPLWEDVVAGVPDSVADQADEITTALDDLQQGDSAAFDSDETFGTYSAVVSAVVADCGFEELAATAVDYGYEGLPESVPAGTVALAMTNASEAEDHEMVVFRKADGETRSVEELLNLGEEESGDALQFVSATFAPPGESGTGLAKLDAGDYAVACFIPVGGGEDGPPHFTQGMFAEFSVE